MSNPLACEHMVAARARVSGQFTDPDVKVYHCIACGIPILGAPQMKFLDPEFHDASFIERAKEFFKEIAKEFSLNLPRLGKK